MPAFAICTPAGFSRSHFANGTRIVAEEITSDTDNAQC